MFVISTAFYVLDVFISVAKVRTEFSRYDDLVFVRYLMGTAYLPKRFAKQGYDIFAKLLPVPERLLLVDIDPEKALRRMASREDREEMFENLPSLEKCREKLLLLSGGWKILDNNGDEVATRRRLDEQLDAWDRAMGAEVAAGGGVTPAAEGGRTSGRC
jgi:thymidylate kinase